MKRTYFTHHFLLQVLKILVTLVHIILGTSKGNDVTLLPWVRESHLNLIKFILDFPNLFSFSSNDCSVESLFNDDVSGFFIFL